MNLFTRLFSRGTPAAAAAAKQPPAVDDLPGWVALLGDRAYGTSARKRLLEMSTEGKPVVDGLATAMRKGNPEQRMAIADLFGELPGAGGARALTESLSDKDWGVRCHCLNALAAIDAIEAVPAIQKLAAGPAGFVSDAAHQALKRLAPDTQRCSHCHRTLVVMTQSNQMMALAAAKYAGAPADMRDAAYQCRNCAALICMRCAESQPCKQCGTRAFDKLGQ